MKPYVRAFASPTPPKKKLPKDLGGGSFGEELAVGEVEASRALGLPGQPAEPIQPPSFITVGLFAFAMLCITMG